MYLTYYLFLLLDYLIKIYKYHYFYYTKLKRKDGVKFQFTPSLTTTFL
ncbi:hypothetical protein BTJ44_01011 [Bacillus mycoides]|nr:hypothetical protein BTJ44_01011 [Bacillus mycoides]